MKLTRAVLALVLAATVAPLATAVPTPAEKDSQKAACEASQKIAHAVYNLGYATARGTTSEGARAAIANLMAALPSAGVDAQPVCFGLAGSFGANFKGTRAEMLDRALNHHLPRALSYTIPQAQNRVAAAAAVNVDDLEYQRRIGAVRTDLDDAVRLLRKVDPLQSYTDPSPQGLLPGQTVEALIVPHGDYYRNVSHGFDGVTYGYTFIPEGWLPVYRTASIPALQKYADSVNRSLPGWALVQQHDADELAWGLEGRLYGPHTPKVPDRFCDVLLAAKILTNAREGGNAESVAETLFNAMSHWGRLNVMVAEEPDAAKRLTMASALSRGTTRQGDMWANSADAGSWSYWRFENEPQKSRCQ